MRLGMSKTDYPFDFFFEKACAEREHQKELGSELPDDDDSNSDAQDEEEDAENDEDEEEVKDATDKGPEENAAVLKSS